MPGRPGGDAPGKLKAVARAWATGRGGEGAIDDDGDPLTAAARDEIERRASRVPAVEVEIGPEEMDVVALFMTLGTQWCWHNFGGPGGSRRVGLNYAAMPPAAAAIGVVPDGKLMADLRAMEGAALAAWAAR